MRRTLSAIALLLPTCWALAAAQYFDTRHYNPRHGFWLEVEIGGGPAKFGCDSCDYQRVTANSSSTLGGWDISVGLGGTPSPRLRIGAEYRGWLHGLKNDTLPFLDLINVLVTLYARDQEGPFLEVGAGVSHYYLGGGDPLEPVSKGGGPVVSGSGPGFKLGVGWEFRAGFSPRITYSYGRAETLAGEGGTIAKGWSQHLLLVEVGFRGGL